MPLLWEWGLVYSHLLKADFFKVKADLVQLTVNKLPKTAELLLQLNQSRLAFKQQLSRLR
jgi:hypothetical protein